MKFRNIKRGFGNVTMVEKDGQQYIFCQRLTSEYQRDVKPALSFDEINFSQNEAKEAHIRAMIESGQAEEYRPDGSHLAGPLNEI